MTHEEKALKGIKPFIGLSKQTEAHQPILSYYLKLFVVTKLSNSYQKFKSQGQSIDKVGPFMQQLMGELKQKKTALGEQLEDKAQNELDLKKFILTLFAKHVNAYENGTATKDTGKNLLVCSRFIESLGVFKPNNQLDQGLNDKKKWAKMKAVELIKGRYKPEDHQPKPQDEEQKVDDYKPPQNNQGGFETPQNNNFGQPQQSQNYGNFQQQQQQNYGQPQQTQNFGQPQQSYNQQQNVQPSKPYVQRQQFQGNAMQIQSKSDISKGKQRIGDLCRYAGMELDHFNIANSKNNVLEALDILSQIEALS